MKTTPNIWQWISVTLLSVVFLAESVGFVVYSHYCTHQHKTTVSFIDDVTCHINTIGICCDTDTSTTTQYHQCHQGSTHQSCCKNNNTLVKITTPVVINQMVDVLKTIPEICLPDYLFSPISLLATSSFETYAPVTLLTSPPQYGQTIIIKNCTLKIWC